MEYPADFWNERFSNEEYIYGTQPNDFFKAQIDTLKSGSILLPAEGEGRNAVYAASQGWDVTAFDISENGKEKALALAKERQVHIHYEISDVLEFQSDVKFDAIGLCYAHFPAEIRNQAHLHLMQFLKPGGFVIFEAFAKAQLGNASGGPKNEEMLFSIEEIKTELSQLDFKLLKEEAIELSEGNHHKGKAEVIRFVGIK
ncbi:class I SAM-dependent methyltransferase [Aequorivita echinoideorum]|uniref:Methyltransferase domain-containing protein n=1 Tax=Aequorivita echinoideorum TaxID=1549647 RepID=A0ABS5S2R7_9FLAO|nr:class I SAM-dependent methyltransferase [Aequorivita echinoideorum]MBT0606734.1 methyltransferase domain-containing protein [Aequorivita echinoideorum]